MNYMMSPFVVLISTVEVSGERAAILGRIGGQVGKEVGKVVGRHGSKAMGELEGAATKLFGDGAPKAEEAATKLLGDVEGTMGKQMLEARDRMGGLDAQTRADWNSYLLSLPAGGGYTQWPGFNEPQGKDGNMKPMGSGPEGTPALEPYGKAKTTDTHTRDTTKEWVSPFGGTYGSNQGSFLSSASSGGSSNYGSRASSSSIFPNPSSSSSSSSSMWGSGFSGGSMSTKACNVPVGTQIQWGSETECQCEQSQTCIRHQHNRCDRGRCIF